jgi:hypothetical protein
MWVTYSPFPGTDSNAGSSVIQMQVLEEDAEFWERRRPRLHILDS